MKTLDHETLAATTTGGIQGNGRQALEDQTLYDRRTRFRNETGRLDDTRTDDPAKVVPRLEKPVRHAPDHPLRKGKICFLFFNGTVARNLGRVIGDKSPKNTFFNDAESGLFCKRKALLPGKIQPLHRGNLHSSHLSRSPRESSPCGPQASPANEDHPRISPFPKKPPISIPPDSLPLSRLLLRAVLDSHSISGI